MDQFPSPGATVVHDILDLPWPFPDATFDSVVAHQVLEHLPAGGDATGKDHIFRVCDEAWRVLKPGGTLEIDVPHLSGRTAFRDFTHRRFFVPMTFSHLWDGQRDPWYPRKIWRLVYCHVLQEVPYQYHMRKYLPKLTGVMEWLPISRPHNIFVKLQKI